jgi:hypothetical protein
MRGRALSKTAQWDKNEKRERSRHSTTIVDRKKYRDDGTR